MLRQDWTIECKAPNELLNQFKGVMRDLRNTKCYYGLVELAHSRKMVTKKFQHTHIDKLLNYLIIGIIILLFTMCAVCTIGRLWVWESFRS